MSDFSTLYTLNDHSLNTKSENERCSIRTVDLVYPHIAVNIGSGVSILLVKSKENVLRVGGTLMGGGKNIFIYLGTLIGLSKLLLNVDNYNDIMKLAEEGDNLNVDLLVKDIYSNTKSSSVPLESDVIASSFGKLHHYIQTGQKEKIRKEDIAKSLLVMICYHIAQLAVLAAQPSDIKK